MATTVASSIARSLARRTSFSSTSSRRALLAQSRTALQQVVVRRCESSSASSTAPTATASPWEPFEMGPLDPIIGLNETFSKDDFPQKQIVGVGAYRDEEGKPYILPCVRKAEKILYDQHLDMEYSGIAGDPKFVELALEFAYGEDCPLLQDKCIQGVQALSGTGGLRVMGELLRRHGHKVIYVPTPTWGNHKAIFTNAGLKVESYRYESNSRLDFEGMVEDIKKMPEGSCILLHACAHNPTGHDPTLEQWQELSHVIKERNLLPFFDAAYQGFASGYSEKDAAALRMFVKDGHRMATIQSFSKNFGLYGHRVGALSIVAADPDEAARVISQMKLVIRPMYSNPPRHGARIVSTVLSDHDGLRLDFMKECHSMADRIHTMRDLLHTKLADVGSIRDWSHITRQIGMFAYSGLSKDQVLEMRDKHHVYCTVDGRISMAGVTSGNAEYIAEAIHDVTK